MLRLCLVGVWSDFWQTFVDEATDVWRRSATTPLKKRASFGTFIVNLLLVSITDFTAEALMVRSFLFDCC